MNTLISSSPTHKAGFVSIIGKPNVGKSTLMNLLLGERLSIVSPKAQTTRHRIMGILNGEDYQIVYSDTPGIITPVYELQKKMMEFVNHTFEDADLVLWLITPEEKPENHIASEAVKTLLGVPLVIAINKIDQCTAEEVEQCKTLWQQFFAEAILMPISAKEAKNTNSLFELVLSKMPFHPPYFPKDELTDRSERFFAAEIIREKIFFNYTQEIPYATEVVITDFKEEENIVRMRAEIYVERPSQKSIIIGKQGSALKKVGTEARLTLEDFFQKKVYLEQHVKVAQDWRKKTLLLKRFGYE
ncbi:MAG: GTPase Era [Cytophagales bacterium]|nr:MAG: GTPase Era [Cytophagales bacterium]